MGLAGNMGRRRAYSPLFRECPKIETPYCYRSELRDAPEEEQAHYYAQLLNREIRRIGKQYVAAFVAEPIVGSSIGRLRNGGQHVRAGSLGVRLDTADVGLRQTQPSGQFVLVHVRTSINI